MDHDYSSNTCDKVSQVEFTYKMRKCEIEDFVRLRVSNNYLFSGRRNTSMWAWRAILKHMGLLHKMTHSQASKKWENMKKRYKELKNPPEGVKVFPETWPYFSLMDDAMAGRLLGKAPVLKVLPNNNDSDDFLPIEPKKRKVSAMVTSPAMASFDDGPEIEVSLNRDENAEEVTVQEGSQEIDHIVQKVEDERSRMDGKQQVMERENKVIERERWVLQRERAVLDRELAVLDRDRALLERERATIEREKAVMERERATVEKDRDAVFRDRLALEEEKARLGRLSAPKERTEEITEDNLKDSDVTDQRERFLLLFEKLIEKF